MKLSDEDTSKVMMNDMPEQSEYSPVIYAAQETGKLVNGKPAGGDFDKCQEANQKAWRDIQSLMAGCIARGMRLARNGQGTNGWIDRPTKVGRYWLSPFCDGRYINPRTVRIIAYAEDELVVDDGGIYVKLALFLKEYYPKSKWMFILQPDCPK